MPYCRDCGDEIYGSGTYCSSCESDIVDRARSRIRNANEAEKRRISNDDNYAHDWLQNLIGWIVKLMSLLSTIRGGCYITSSVVSFLGLPDDGEEMTAFRDFRKRTIYLSDNPDRKQDLDDYYIVGLRLVNWANSRYDSNAIWKYVSSYVMEFLSLINRGADDDAYTFFKTKTLSLELDVLLGKHLQC